MKIGTSFTSECVVTADKTAIALGSGICEVFATPALAALMEEACWKAVQSFLTKDQSTVGTALTLSHIAATPIGMRVTARATLTNIDKRRLEFSVEAYDEVEKIGEATHQRAIIDNSRFMARVEDKKAR